MAAYSFLAIEFQIQCDSISVSLSVYSFYLTFGHFSMWCKFTYTLITERKQKRKKHKETAKEGKYKQNTPPINRTFEYYEYCLTMISFYFGRTIPVSKSH